jgi:N-acylglucosamine 2-epimerase
MPIDGVKFSEIYQRELSLRVLPFWQDHSLDEECGGYFTCLDREGKVYDTDKFVWLQARQVWTFARIYNRVDGMARWLDIARHGAEFLAGHGRDRQGDWYFSLDRRGRPLVQPYNIFSDCFAAMAFAELATATAADEHRQVAVTTFENILRRRENPKGRYSKTVKGTRPLINFALPMILCNLTLELEPVLSADRVERTIDECLELIMGLFYHPEEKLVFENVNPDGSLSDCFDGRLINPGHGIEAMWFVMAIARRRQDRSLFEKATQIVIDILEFGWDEEYGGLYYFLDAKGHPPQQLEWDQKLWWVHLEALVALSTALAGTGRAECRRWFERIHEYAWDRFPDPKYGEWFGYLNRRGEVLLDLKGGKWKGCFHVPRALMRCSEEWRRIEG